MALKKCPACGGMIAPSASACPHCGKRFTSAATILFLIAIMLAFIGMGLVVPFLNSL